MALGPRLDLRQSQSLVMTPQLQQAIKLLALSNLELEAFLGDAVAANPLLELTDGPGDQGEAYDLEAAERRTSLETSPADRLIADAQGQAEAPLEIGIAYPGSGAGSGDGDWGSAFGAEAGDEGFGRPDEPARETSLADHLNDQVGASRDDPRTVFLARHLIGLLDEAGYLTVPLDEVSRDLGVAAAEVEAALQLVQSLDPTGVGARDLRECIALQAMEADRHDPSMARLIDNLDLVARGDIARLKRICHVDDDDLADMLAELRRYDPKPGQRFATGGGDPVTPDILLEPTEDGEGWSLSLNQATMPRLVVNRSYYLELRGSCPDKPSRAWLSERLTDANWLIKAIDQRQKTILKVAEEIVRQQDGFFRRGVAHLKPLTLRAVAEAIGMHESTVSRVTSNKYLHCARGTFELKYFFTSGVASADGMGAASAEAVKAAIRSLIDGESAQAILSDDALVDLLKAWGFDLARRTVAKYREAIGLGSSVQRRRRKALAGVR